MFNKMVTPTGGSSKIYFKHYDTTSSGFIFSEDIGFTPSAVYVKGTFVNGSTTAEWQSIYNSAFPNYAFQLYNNTAYRYTLPNSTGSYSPAIGNVSGSTISVIISSGVNVDIIAVP